MRMDINLYVRQSETLMSTVVLNCVLLPVHVEYYCCLVAIAIPVMNRALKVLGGGGGGGLEGLAGWLQSCL